MTNTPGSSGPTEPPEPTEPPGPTEPPDPRHRILRLWRIWQPIGIVAMFGAFGGPQAWVPLFQVVLVVVATVPLLLGHRLLDAAGLAEHDAQRLRRLLWALSVPMYAVVLALFFLR